MQIGILNEKTFSFSSTTLIFLASEKFVQLNNAYIKIIFINHVLRYLELGGIVGFLIRITAFLLRHILFQSLLSRGHYT